MSRNGTPLQRLRDRSRISLAPERRAVFEERRLEMQAESAAETVLGNRPFDVVNVAGTDVAPFLGKTDGEKLVDPGGLDDGYVDTLAIDTAAVTSGATSSVGGVVSLNAALETTIATRSYTTTGGELEIEANFHLTVWHPLAGPISCRIRMYRDAVVIFDKTFVAIDGDLIQGWQTPRAVETMAAGTYTYSVTAQASVSNYATAEADAGSVSVREFKR
jgi:hypothetical protein